MVIPCLNAGSTLGQTLSCLKSEIIEEIWVVDGGSTDNSVEIAQNAGAAVLPSPRGRGLQLQIGGKAVRSDFILFLHADSVLGQGWGQVVRDFMIGADSLQKAGYFQLAINDDARLARVLEKIVAGRCRLLGLPYGDQGLLIAKAFYQELGGFEPLPLMEDVALVRKIGKARLEELSAQCRTSAIRYQREGYLRRTSTNLGCLAAYFLGVPPSTIVHWYNR